MVGERMYENIYRTNPQTGNSIIDISLDDYMDFFHEWDNAVFKKRDMHPELAEFLKICSEDIPLRNKIEISFSVENEVKDEEKENLILESYRNYYAFYSRLEKKKIKAHLFKAMFLALTSMVLILSYEILANVWEVSVWGSLFLEFLMIGGWVFMWEALHVITFERYGHVKINRELKRFLTAPILFEYKDKAVAN